MEKFIRIILDGALKSVKMDSQEENRESINIASESYQKITNGTVLTGGQFKPLNVEWDALCV